MKSQLSPDLVRFSLTLASALLMTSAVADPLLSSWHIQDTSQYARVRETDASPAAGATTWTGQALPAYAGLQELADDGTNVYARSSGLASYVMGPWYLNAARTQLFPNRPLAADRVRRFTRTPSPAATKTLTGLGSIGMYVNGVSLFDNRDGFIWTGTGEAGNGTGYWQRDAWVNEGITFDAGFAHQEQTGNYHYHAFPPALRYQVGDHVDYDPGTGRYLESTSPPAHSPILAWVADGFPLYGPYGYANPTQPAGGVRRMVSGYVLRDGGKGTDDLRVTGRSTIPAWAQRAYAVAAAQSGPAVSTTYPLGRYLEDNAYLGDLTNTVTGQKYVLGVDFDLNEQNCRWCVTPEFPQGTWAYFCTITSSNTPAFPYAIGRQYFGTPDNTQLTAIPAAATRVFRGGPNHVEALSTPTVAGQDLVLTWSGVEGAAYRVESSTRPGGFVSLATNLSPLRTSGQFVHTNVTTQPMQFYRVVRTGLADYYGSGAVNTNNPTATISASPASAVRGTTLTVTFTLNATATPPLPPANVLPSSVMIGGIAGTGIARPASTTVTASFILPANALSGSQTMAITFPGMGGGNGPSYTQAAGFTIN